MGFALYATCCFSLAAFNLSLCLIFVSLISMCFGMFLLGFILYGTLCLLDLIGYFLFHVAEILSIIFSNIFSYPFFFSSSSVQVSSVQFSHSVVSDSLRPHELQHARPPCPSLTPRVPQTHIHRVSDTIQPSHPRSPSPPAPNPSQY